MTLFLASVRDPAEVESALAAGADIVDLKDPSQGALGALDAEAIAACVRVVAGRAPVSATIGDLPPDSNRVRGGVLETAALGVDYVKIGLFPGGDAERGLNRLKTAARRVRIVVVLFADALPDVEAIGLAARIGAHGVMFDTMGKGAGSLTDHMTYMNLAGHIAMAKAEGLVVGLAGALAARHVPSLLALGPDLLGFRGALCEAGDRTQTLDAGRVAAIRALIPERPRILPERNLSDIAPHALC
jgi:dihydroneopterin aldolase